MTLVALGMAPSTWSLLRAQLDARTAERDAMQRRAEAAETDWQAVIAERDEAVELLRLSWPVVSGRPHELPDQQAICAFLSRFPEPKEETCDAD